MKLANFNNINVELQKISERLELKKFSLKIPRFQLEINDTPIECIDNFNFLELTIYKHLNWKNRTDKLACKIS